MCFIDFYREALFYLTQLFNWISDHATVLAVVATAYFTYKLTSISARQGKILEDSLYISKVSADAALKSAQATSDMMTVNRDQERAYVFLDIENISSSLYPDDNPDPKSPDASSVKFRFWNHGRTPAILKELAVVCAFYRSDLDPKEADRVTTHLTPGLTIGPNSLSTVIEIRFGLTNEEMRKTEKHEGTILLSSCLAYEDIFGLPHRTSVLLYFDYNQQKFRQHNSKALNYFD